MKIASASLLLSVKCQTKSAVLLPRRYIALIKATFIISRNYAELTLLCAQLTTPLCAQKMLRTKFLCKKLWFSRIFCSHTFCLHTWRLVTLCFRCLCQYFYSFTQSQYVLSFNTFVCMHNAYFVNCKNTS